MTCLRSYVTCSLVLLGMMFFVSNAMGADDVMVLRYDDGATQRVKLEREFESIRQIEFLEGRGERDRKDWRRHSADDVMVLRYDDGATQRIKLERESESIRQIEFLEGRGERDRQGWRDNRIRVIGATYGANCGAPPGNATNDVAQMCDGQTTCEYVIDIGVLGDPTPGCPKNYSVEWQCGRDPQRGQIAPGQEASGTRIVLRCPVR